MSIQIPDLHISNTTKVNGEAQVDITERKDAQHKGTFSISVSFGFDPSTDAYPQGVVTIKIDLSDSIKGTATATKLGLEQVDTMGKHTPTVFVTGRCTVSSVEEDKIARESRFWLMIANNKRSRQIEPPKPTKLPVTPDVVSFLIYDRNGKRVAYGTGPVTEGDIEVAASSD